jgi:hypothetical protein
MTRRQQRRLRERRERLIAERKAKERRRPERQTARGKVPPVSGLASQLATRMVEHGWKTTYGLRFPTTKRVAVWQKAAARAAARGQNALNRLLKKAGRIEKGALREIEFRAAQQAREQVRETARKARLARGAALEAARRQAGRLYAKQYALRIALEFEALTQAWAKRTPKQ